MSREKFVITPTLRLSFNKLAIPLHRCHFRLTPMAAYHAKANGRYRKMRVYQCVKCTAVFLTFEVLP